jgi:arginine-tRNA-protein transferase
MSLTDGAARTRFFVTQPQACPYLEGRVEQKVVTVLGRSAAQEKYDLLNRNGFRRSHEILYRPACPACQACVPVRVLVDAFRPGRSMRKVLSRNAGLRARELPAFATGEQFRLFTRYQDSRHGGGDMARMTLADYRSMVEDSPVDTRIVEFRDADYRLVAASLVDELEDGMSAVYLFFEPELADRSLGTYQILWMIERTRARGLPHLYLGYWIAESPKMAYKARFGPMETLERDGWRRRESLK